MTRSTLTMIGAAAVVWGVAVHAGAPSSRQTERRAVPREILMRVNPIDLAQGDLDAGKAAFAAHCASCHGADGKGRASADAPAPDLTRAEMRRTSDPELFWLTGSGHADPGTSFESALSEVQRWQVVAYLRVLEGIKLPVHPGGPGYVWTLPPGFPRPRVPADNPMSDAKVELGRFLFYDRRLSIDGSFSCASCHKQALAFTDGRPQGVGVTGAVHPRGAMSLTNIGYAPVLTWANPLLRRLEAQALVPMFGDDPVEMGLSGREQALVEALGTVPQYQRLFPAAFPGDASPISVANITRALASFERSLISGRSPYDRYRTGEDPTAISESAKRGEALFFAERAECFHCHGSFNFTETVDFVGKGFAEIEFHNTGLYNLGGTGGYPAPNTGVFAITGNPNDMGRFKAPSLRNIAVTAPYMHDGSIATLDGVIAHYASGGRTITSGPHAGVGSANPNKSEFVRGFDFTPEERADLLALLESLTDRDFLTDPRFADPWPAHAAGAVAPARR
jgi:cytochrome c peroxidase